MLIIDLGINDYMDYDYCLLLYNIISVYTRDQN